MCLHHKSIVSIIWSNSHSLFLTLTRWLQESSEGNSHLPTSKSEAIPFLPCYSKGVGLSQRPISQHVHCIPTSSCILRDFIPFIILSLFCLHFPFYQINFHSSQLCFIIFHPRQHNPKHINYIIPLEVLLVYLNFLPSQVSQKRDYLCCHHLHLPFTQHTKSGFHSQHTTKAALEPITSNACIQHTQCCSVTSNTQCELFFSLSFTSQEHLTKLITLLWHTTFFDFPNTTLPWFCVYSLGVPSQSSLLTRLCSLPNLLFFPIHTFLL